MSLSCSRCGGPIGLGGTTQCQYCKSFLPKEQQQELEESLPKVTKSADVPKRKKSDLDLLSLAMARVNRQAPRILLDETYPFGDHGWS